MHPGGTVLFVYSAPENWWHLGPPIFPVSFRTFWDRIVLLRVVLIKNFKLCDFSSGHLDEVVRALGYNFGGFCNTVHFRLVKPSIQCFYAASTFWKLFQWEQFGRRHVCICPSNKSFLVAISSTTSVLPNVWSFYTQYLNHNAYLMDSSTNWYLRVPPLLHRSFPLLRHLFVKAVVANIALSIKDWV